MNLELLLNPHGKSQELPSPTATKPLDDESSKEKNISIGASKTSQSAFTGLSNKVSISYPEATLINGSSASSGKNSTNSSPISLASFSQKNAVATVEGRHHLSIITPPATPYSIVNNNQVNNNTNSNILSGNEISPSSSVGPTTPNKRTYKSNRLANRLCANCFIDHSTNWRRHPSKDEYLCNACGLYVVANGRPRPLKNVLRRQAKNSTSNNVNGTNHGSPYATTVTPNNSNSHAFVASPLERNQPMMISPSPTGTIIPQQQSPYFQPNPSYPNPQFQHKYPQNYSHQMRQPPQKQPSSFVSVSSVSAGAYNNIQNNMLLTRGLQYSPQPYTASGAFPLPNNTSIVNSHNHHQQGRPLPSSVGGNISNPYILSQSQSQSLKLPHQHSLPVNQLPSLKINSESTHGDLGSHPSAGSLHTLCNILFTANENSSINNNSK